MASPAGLFDTNVEHEEALLDALGGVLSALQIEKGSALSSLRFVRPNYTVILRAPVMLSVAKHLPSEVS